MAMSCAGARRSCDEVQEDEQYEREAQHANMMAGPFRCLGCAQGQVQEAWVQNR
jgi:hypothetical protein